MSHPLMYVLGDKTLAENFPLILIIGREPNCDEPLNDSVDLINPDEFRSMRSGVWIVAYSQIGRQLAPSQTGGQLKHRLLACNASPIAFTNMYPVGISSTRPRKQAARDAIPLVDIEAHMQRILQTPLMNRVKLVINHSGCISSNTMGALWRLKEHCLHNGIIYCDTPLFTNYNARAIQVVLAHQAPVIQDIFRRLNCCGFLQARSF